MKRSLRKQTSDRTMRETIRFLQSSIEYILWLLSERKATCQLNIVGYTMYSSDTYEVTEGYKDGAYGACARSTRSYYNSSGDFLYTRRVVRFGQYPGSALNQYADRGSPDCVGNFFTDLSDPTQEYVGPGWGISTSASWGSVTNYGSYYERVSTTTTAATPSLCDDPISAYGWFYTSKLVRTYRIIRDPSLGDLMDGQTYLWEATTVGSAEVSATVTPNSGSYTWAHGETEKFITLTLEFVEATNMENKWGSYGQRILLELQRNARHTDCQYNHTWVVV